MSGAGPGHFRLVQEFVLGAPADLRSVSGSTLIFLAGILQRLGRAVAELDALAVLVEDDYEHLAATAYRTPNAGMS
jgi:hypothetical protein